jgi:organic radical activating enzyme
MSVIHQDRGRNMTSFRKMWDGQSLPSDGARLDCRGFSGMMRRPDYINYLEKIANPSVHLELTSICNFFCSYCYSSKSVRPKGFMKEELFYHIADQLPGFASEVALYVDGEPTLHPKFYSFVKYLKAKEIPVHVASNASNLKFEFLDLPIKITSYISSCKEELALRTKIKFDKYIGKIIDYIDKWHNVDSSQSIDLRIYCSYEDFTDKQRQRSKMDFAIGILKTAGFDIEAADVNSEIFFRHRNGAGGVLTFSWIPIGTGGLFPGEKKFANSASIVRDMNFGFCDSAWQRMVIYWDGSVALCCQALQGETQYAEPDEIWNTSLKELWSDHPNARIFRARMKLGELILPGCKKCLSNFPNREFYINTGSYVPMYELQIGNKITFEENPEAREMLLSGFAVTPLNIAWTNNERSEFGFRVPSPPRNRQGSVLMDRLHGFRSRAARDEPVRRRECQRGIRSPTGLL